jgi:IKI3 family
MAASGSPKVVLQMPRGNLEGIEPRPLIFLKARELIDSLDMLSCLLLLRRQKVDLNYLIDYNPVVFLSQVGSLVKRCLASNPDLLSLLISSLEPGDTTSFKYPTYAPDGTLPGDVTWRERQLPSPDFYSGMKKVNIVCTAVRDSLLGFLNSTQGPPQLSALYPALCTYAKQSPPLLVEALSLIKTSSSPSTSSSSSSSSQNRGSEELLAVAKVPAAIKYLAFLAEGSALFDAALGRCDFDMARAVARQCQMDPKAYLPLLKVTSALCVCVSCLGVCVCVCLDADVSVFHRILLSIFLCICLCVHMSIIAGCILYLHIFILSSLLSIRPSVCLPVYPSVCLSVCLSTCLSVCLISQFPSCSSDSPRDSKT